MHLFKRLLATIGILCLSVVLVSCGNKEQESKVGGKVTIEYFNQKKEMSPTLKKIISDFEKENPNIHVKLTDVPNAGTVLKTRVLAGDMPDVVNIYPQNIDFQEWAKAGYFEDLSNQSYLKNIKNDFEKRFKVNGKVYNVPLTANVYGFFYNKTAFKELGVSEPKTWTEFEALVKELIAKDQTPFAIAGTEPWTLNGYHQLALATVTGGGKQANELLRYSKPNALTVDNKYLKEDFERLDLLRMKGAAQKNWRGASYNDAVVSFASGKSLIMPNGSWALAMIQQQKPNFEVGTFAFPGNVPGEELTVGSGDLALSIAADSKHKAAAQKFVAYMTTKKAMQKYYDVDGSPVAVKGVKEAGPGSPLYGLSRLAFTKHQIIWLAQDWTSENDFFNLTTNYLMNGDKQEMVDSLNTFFNPMKVSND